MPEPKADGSEATANRKLRIVLMGTGPFAVPAFEAIRNGNDHVTLVVTKPQVLGKSRKPASPSPVRVWAEANTLPIYDPDSINEPAAVERMIQEEADLFVVCDYGHILSRDALAASSLGGINLHGSLLPKFRGAAPVQRAVLEGEATTGVSVIHMTPRLDGGPVLSLAETAIGETETAGELEQRLSVLGVQPTLESIDKLRSWDGESMIGEKQDPSQATKAPRLAKSDGRIDWNHTIREIDCRIRAMQPWPGAFTEADGGKQPLRLVICKATNSERPRPGDASNGQALIDGDNLDIVAADGCVRISRLKPAGKREMDAAEFLRGNRLANGQILR